MSIPLGTHHSTVGNGFRRVFRAGLWSIFLGVLLSALAWGVYYYLTVQKFGQKVWWWDPLPYGYRQALAELMVPGWVVWWCALGSTNNESLALWLGFATNAIAYGAVLFFPLIVLELILAATGGREDRPEGSRRTKNS